MTDLESAEDFHARVAAATDDEGRLPVAIELMPGWDIFPFELDGLRIKPLEPHGRRRAAAARRGPGRLRVPPSRGPRAGRAGRLEQRALAAQGARHEAPVTLILQPRAHHDLADLPDDLASEMGRLMVAITAARRGAAERRALPRRSLRRRRRAPAPVLLRPAGPDAAAARLVRPGLGGEPPPVPEDVRRANAAHVGRRLRRAPRRQRPRVGGVSLDVTVRPATRLTSPS